MGNEIGKVDRCINPDAVSSTMRQAVETIPAPGVGLCTHRPSDHAMAVEYDGRYDDIDGPDESASSRYCQEVAGSVTQACASRAPLTYSDGQLKMCGVNVDGSSSNPLAERSQSEDSDVKRSMEIGSMRDLQSGRIDKWSMPGKSAAPQSVNNGPRGLMKGHFVAETEQGVILKLPKVGPVMFPDNEQNGQLGDEAWQKLEDANSAIGNLSADPSSSSRQAQSETAKPLLGA
eukprot:CAMPEP_0178440230 /NCGR_PEP_ID=MMETSP0689_2-20121128/36641_1 /TAXON_ID=160604 /ORGANISM="Amphidinium massartii, Strain CS-259" /LENGTH=231 /DNA_ID=CAMNT_0020062937 /DNA_START=97 /DNA_END=788 /DNA_ORIENTATION=+